MDDLNPIEDGDSVVPLPNEGGEILEGQGDREEEGFMVQNDGEGEQDHAFDPHQTEDTGNPLAQEQELGEEHLYVGQQAAPDNEVGDASYGGPADHSIEGENENLPSSDVSKTTEIPQNAGNIGEDSSSSSKIATIDAQANARTSESSHPPGPEPNNDNDNNSHNNRNTINKEDSSSGNSHSSNRKYEEEHRGSSSSSTARRGDDRDRDDRSRGRDSHSYGSGSRGVAEDPPIRARLFVSNVDPLAIKESEVRERFSKYGRVLEVSVHKHFMFVQLDSESGAQTAINSENHTEMGGRRIEVSITKWAKKDQPSRARSRSRSPPPRRHSPPPRRSPPRRRSRSRSPPRRRSPPPSYCKDFRVGNCFRGARCKYSHIPDTHESRHRSRSRSPPRSRSRGREDEEVVVPRKVVPGIMECEIIITSPQPMSREVADQVGMTLAARGFRVHASMLDPHMTLKDLLLRYTREAVPYACVIGECRDPSKPVVSVRLLSRTSPESYERLNVREAIDLLVKHRDRALGVAPLPGYERSDPYDSRPPLPLPTRDPFGPSDVASRYPPSADRYSGGRDGEYEGRDAYPPSYRGAGRGVDGGSDYPAYPPHSGGPPPRRDEPVRAPGPGYGAPSTALRRDGPSGYPPSYEPAPPRGGAPYDRPPPPSHRDDFGNNAGYRGGPPPPSQPAYGASRTSDYPPRGDYSYPPSQQEYGRPPTHTASRYDAPDRGQPGGLPARYNEEPSYPTRGLPSARPGPDTSSPYLGSGTRGSSYYEPSRPPMDQGYPPPPRGGPAGGADNWRAKPSAQGAPLGNPDLQKAISDLLSNIHK